jgi:hypothetical protein
MLQPGTTDPGRINRAVDLQYAAAALMLAANQGWKGEMIGIFPHLEGREDPKKVLSELMRKHRLPARAAGFILHRIISRHAHDPSRPSSSVHEAAKAFVAQCQDQGTHLTVENVRLNWWRKYRSVAHLWAAWPPHMSIDIDVYEARDVYGFLAAAQRYADAAAGIVPRYGREPVLQLADAWTVPDSVVAFAEGEPVNL